MYAITGNGLENAKRYTVTAGHVYYLGASDMPERIHVLAVTPDRIVYAKTFRGTKTSIDRRSGEDLIARGCATVARRYAAYPDVVKAIGAYADPAAFDRYTVNVRPVSGAWDHGDSWRAAEEYGNVGGCLTTMTLEIECDGAAFSRLLDDARFTVVKDVCTHTHPRG